MRPGIERMRDGSRRLVEYYRSVVGPDADHGDLLRLALVCGGPCAVRDLREALSLVETPVQSMAIVFGSFAPASKDIVDFIRDLAKTHDKVIIGVQQGVGTLPFEKVGAFLGISLPDIERKLEIHRVNATEIGAALQQIANDGSVYRGEQGGEVYTCEDSPGFQRNPSGSAVDLSVLSFRTAPAATDRQLGKLLRQGNFEAAQDLMDPRVQNQPDALRKMFSQAEEVVREDEDHGAEDPHGLQAALATVPPEERRKRLSQFGRWARIQDSKAALALYRVTVDEEDPYLDVGGEYVLTCRIFILPVEEFARQTGRAGQGTGHIVDAEIFFRDVDGREPFLWHNETRVQSRQEAVERVKRVQRWLDGRTLDQLAADRKSGDLQMSKLGEAATAPTLTNPTGDTNPAGTTLSWNARDVKTILSLAKSAVSRNAERLARHGVTPGAVIGQGMRGVAFEAGGNRVLKVTLDESEVRASLHLVGKDLKYVVRFYEVFRFPQEEVPLYGIVEERLQPLGQTERAQVDHAFGLLQTAFAADAGGLTFQNLEWSEITDRVRRGRDPKLVKSCIIFEKLGIPQILDELRRNGVRWGDIHGGNLMRRGDTVVAIDLGVSESPQGGQVPVLEVRTLGEDLPVADQSPLKALGGPEAVKAILQAKVQPLANQKGIRVSGLRPIGSGDNGVAFDMGGGKCLKVTVDEDEAQAAWNLRGKGGQHINRFYDVFRIQKVPSPVYCIVSDLLRPLDEQEAADFTETMSRAHLRVVERSGKIADENDDFIDSLAREPWPATWAKIQSSIMQDVREEMKLGPESAPKLVKRAELIGRQRAQEALQGLERFKVPEMVEELRKAGVQFADFHAGNILKRGSDYVLNDLSRAKSGPADIEDLTEWMESSPRISSVSAWSSGMMALMNRPSDDDDTEDDEDRDTGGPARSVDRLEFR